MNIKNEEIYIIKYWMWILCLCKIIHYILKVLPIWAWHLFKLLKSLEWMLLECLEP